MNIRDRGTNPRPLLVEVSAVVEAVVEGVAQEAAGAHRSYEDLY